MWKGILETYRVLLAQKDFPRSKAELEKEYRFLQLMAKDSGHIEDETGLRGQFGGHRE